MVTQTEPSAICCGTSAIVNPEDYLMKKAFARLVLVVLLMLVMAMPAFAEGGQVRGDNAQGAANQVQVQDPPPFQP